MSTQTLHKGDGYNNRAYGNEETTAGLKRPWNHGGLAVSRRLDAGMSSREPGQRLSTGRGGGGGNGGRGYGRGRGRGRGCRGREGHFFHHHHRESSRSPPSFPAPVNESMGCSVCGAAATTTPKYKCPQCSAPYCSVACCRQHKVIAICRPPLAGPGVTERTILEQRSAVGIHPTRHSQNTSLVFQPGDWEDLPAGWQLTPDMVQALHASPWLTQELSGDNGVGLPDLVRRVATASKATTTTTNHWHQPSPCSQQEHVLQQLQAEMPHFQRFCDKLLVIAGVLERPPDHGMALEDWLSASTSNQDYNTALTLVPLHASVETENDVSSTSSSASSATSTSSTSSDELSDGELTS